MPGQGNIQFTRRIPPAGAPFAAGSAGNGLHVDPATGRIFLGGSALEEVTVVDLAGIRLQFADNAPGGIGGLLLEPVLNQIIIGSTAAPTAFINLNNGPGNQTIEIHVGNAEIQMSDSGVMLIGNNISQNGTQILIDDINQTIDWRSAATSVIGISANFLTNVFTLGGSTSPNGNIIEIDDSTNTVDIRNNALNSSLSINGNPGASGTFTTVDLKTVVVEGGLITSIT
jgi:hypothetical protein